MYCNIPCNKADCNLRCNLIIVECIRVCCCVCRYVRFLQTKGKESFKIHLESCSYVGPVPYHFRERGVAGIIVNHTHCALFIINPRGARVTVVVLCVCVCVRGPHLRLTQLSDKLDILVVSV